MAIEGTGVSQSSAGAVASLWWYSRHGTVVLSSHSLDAVAVREVVNGIVQMRREMAIATATASRHATMPVHIRPAQSKTYRTVR